MASDPPEFIPVTAADQARLLALMQRIYPPVYAHFWPDDGAWYLESQYGPANLARELQDELADYRFVVLDDRPIGIVRLRLATTCPDRPGVAAAKLHRLYVDPTVHGHGVGRAAIVWCGEQAGRAGAELLWLEAMDSAATALGFYRHLGFAVTAPFLLDMPRMYPELRGMYRMARLLSS